MRYHEFVRRVQEQGEFDSRDEAVTAIKATLSSLGECLYRTERRHLASQLPKEAAAFLEEYVNSEVRRPPAACLTLQEFYDRVGARADVTRTHAMDRAKTVAAVLQELVPEAEWEHIVEEMPKQYRELLGAEPPGPASPTRV
jgi:uncharacterized protein (DUF2267 family)